jgi:hypothetical protein
MACHGNQLSTRSASCVGYAGSHMSAHVSVQKLANPIIDAIRQNHHFAIKIEFDRENYHRALAGICQRRFQDRHLANRMRIQLRD